MFLGRPVLWALACGGADGVRSLLKGLTDDLAHAMALAGATSVAGTAGAGPARRSQLALTSAGRWGCAVAAGQAQAYLGNVRAAHHPRRERPQLVTEARKPLSQDIAYRERRYLIMMGIRLVCFVVAVVLFVNGAGWLTAIPAGGSDHDPVFCRRFRQWRPRAAPAAGFRAYQPNLPQRYTPPAQNQQPGTTAYTGTAEPGTDGPGESRQSGHKRRAWSPQLNGIRKAAGKRRISE